eukprot:scaffold10328_cov112-Isochrysis_galbana.AAC.2
MRCPGHHRAEPTTGSRGPCAGPQVPVPTLWPNLETMWTVAHPAHVSSSILDATPHCAPAHNMQHK